MLAAICRAVPDGDVVVPALLYAGGWVLMIAAMMLPTTLPILEMFRRMTASAAGRRPLLALRGRGLPRRLARLRPRRARRSTGWCTRSARALPWLAFHGWVVGAAVLAAAGPVPVQRAQVPVPRQCHTPLAFIIERWHGRRPAREALLLGVDHGAFCVGCCWALMLLMFVVGTGSLGWMLVLAAVMAAEKNLPGGGACARRSAWRCSRGRWGSWWPMRG